MNPVKWTKAKIRRHKRKKCLKNWKRNVIAATLDIYNGEVHARIGTHDGLIMLDGRSTPDTLHIDVTPRPPQIGV